MGWLAAVGFIGIPALEETRQKMHQAVLYYCVYSPSDDATPNVIVLKHGYKFR